MLYIFRLSDYNRLQDTKESGEIKTQPPHDMYPEFWTHKKLN